MRRAILLLTTVLCCELLCAQTRPITGKVIDDKGNPVAFASVKIRGTRTGTSADANGVFKLDVRDNDVLEISGTGMTPANVPVSGKTEIAVTLITKSSELTSVVVTALGVRRQAKE